MNKINLDLGLRSRKLQNSFTGRLTRWKGQEMFLEALYILKNKFSKNNFQSIILGSHQGRKVYYKKLLSITEQYKLQKNVIFFTGFKEMPIMYYISDIVVSSSIEPEAFGRVSVEAQSMQKPIIASDLGGSKETIIDGKTGFLFKNNSRVSS